MTSAVIVLVVIQVILQVLAAVLSPAEARAPQDERDREIQIDGRAFGFYALQVAVMAAAVSVYFADKWVVVNLIFGALGVSELARLGHVVLSYRRGA